ncbi:MAG TPA: tRNA 2-thiouridine(34) synthase MnmA [Candidatus Paceibacterota bacterium]|nr:tRNA 2-thiouridine(34) synthase MnmA [Candidatus Paceibacterota bacterium]
MELSAVRGKKISVGLSGGVDSAVSAALLARAGAKVTGVFIKGWYPPGLPCTWAEERRDAMRVAARLHIPFETLDASAEYKKSVIDYLLAEYRAGRTPNPDVMCNRDVKFGAFYRYATATGADAIATGHYLSGEKDQRYFLWAVPKDILGATVFPVGHRAKESVRKLAHRFDLPVADKPDSQGVCFLGPVSVEEFLRSEFGEAPGRAVDEDGRTVGAHDGVFLYTIGERVALRDASIPGPWYVCAKRVEAGELVVSPRRAPMPAARARGIRFTNANWFGEPGRVTHAQYRYRGPRVTGCIADDAFVADEPLPEVSAAGQSLVFWRDDELTGGGIIAA